MVDPLVTIVVAAHCPEREHFAVAIDSALEQSYVNLEIIVGDDSPDNSLQALVLARNDPRVRYSHHRPSLGVAANHWAAFKQARGEYIVILNHDDWLAPAFVVTMVSALQQHDAAVLAFCDHWVVDGRGQRLLAETEANTVAWGRAGLAVGLHCSLADLLATQAIPMAMGTMFRRSALPTRMPTNAGPAYDLWLTYVLARSGGGAHYVTERLSAWRSHPGNLTTAAGLAWLQGAASCWQAVAGDNALSGIRHEARAKAASALSACAVRSWRDGHLIACARFAVRSLLARVTRRGLGLLFLPLLPRSFDRFTTSRRAGR